jgi:hypothetical protein
MFTIRPKRKSSVKNAACWATRCLVSLQYYKKGRDKSRPCNDTFRQNMGGFIAARANSVILRGSK